MSIGKRFRSYLPKERIRSIWESEAGLAFVQRQRIETGLWESADPQPTGLYHLVVHAADCELTVRHNGVVRYGGYLPANTIQFSRPDEEVHCEGRGSIRLLTVSFTTEFLTSHLESLLVTPDLIELRAIASTSDVGLASLAEAYEAVSARTVSVTPLYFDILRQAMFNRIVLRHVSRSIRPNFSEVLVPTRARRVIDYIETNLETDLRLAELSAVAEVSRAHFARAFRNTVGMTPHAFVLQRRLTRAIELLASGTQLINEVAVHCGFADQAHLTRVFKSRFGHPPSIYLSR